MTTQRILIEASKLADQDMDGIKRYVVELLNALAPLVSEEGVMVDVLVHGDVMPLSDVFSGGNEPAARPLWVRMLVRAIPGKLLAFLWKRRILKTTAQSVDLEAYDLVHLTLPNNYHLLPETNTPKLVTVHDISNVVCPQFQSRDNVLTLKMGLDRAVVDDAGFLAVSGSTGAQLMSEYEQDSSRVDIVHNGCSPENFYPVQDPEIQASVRCKYGIPDAPFLLTMSTIEPRKNLENTIRAFQQLMKDYEGAPATLVIAGNRGWKSRRIRRLAEATPQVHLTGYIASEDLAALYSSALGFVYVSHYEGFGLPLLEAMRCGVPVIYGNNSSMPEIVGEAGLAADSHDVGDMARQMRRLLDDEALRVSLGQLAQDRARVFSWQQTAQKTLQLYRKYGKPAADPPATQLNQTF